MSNTRTAIKRRKGTRNRQAYRDIDYPKLGRAEVVSGAATPNTALNRKLDMLSRRIEAVRRSVLSGHASSAVTGSTTLDASHSFVLVDASSGAVTITLPPAASAEGREYNIKKTDSSSNSVTIDGDGSETIDDSTTAVIATQYDSVTVVSDGSEWWIQ